MKNIVHTHYDASYILFYLHAHPLIRAQFIFEMYSETFHCEETARVDIRTRGFFEDWCKQGVITLGEMESLQDFVTMSVYFPDDTPVSDDMIVKWGTKCATMEDLCSVWKRAFDDSDTPDIQEKRCGVILGFMKQKALTAKLAKMAHAAIEKSCKEGAYWKFAREIEVLWKALLQPELEMANTLELAKELAENCPDDDRFASPPFKFAQTAKDHWVKLWLAEAAAAAKTKGKDEAERLLLLRPIYITTEDLQKKLQKIAGQD
ncbi:MAG: hypothetical protein JWO73_535 [Candidatus Taylorbacteria bacterium]|nr:hypothetical protein [Candidatus Taylorbacteria bacterium]